MPFASASLDVLLLDRSSAADRLAAANELVNAYLYFVKDADIGNDFVDEIELPYAKPILIDAFRHAIAAETQSDIRTLLIKAGMTLAQYHNNLGERIRVRPVTRSGRAQLSRNRGWEKRFEKMLIAAADERVRLSEVYRLAMTRNIH
jgi:hypothetical protein